MRPQTIINRAQRESDAFHARLASSASTFIASRETIHLNIWNNERGTAACVPLVCECRRRRHVSVAPPALTLTLTPDSAA